jgi:hypothetical protein
MVPLLGFCRFGFVALVLVGLVRLGATTIHNKKFMQNLFSEQANLSPVPGPTVQFSLRSSLNFKNKQLLQWLTMLQLDDLQAWPS